MTKPITYDQLKQARDAFNSFATSVLPEEDLDKDEHSCSDLARRISDDASRERFCQLAVAMLDANIAYHQDDATRKRPSRPSHKFVVTSTLITAGLVQHYAGTAASLIGAGIWYWLSETVMNNRMNDLKAEARIHNAGVSEWDETIRNWKAEREGLLRP